MLHSNVPPEQSRDAYHPKRSFTAPHSATTKVLCSASAALVKRREFIALVRFHRGARPCLGSGRQRGQHDHALGRSRGGFSNHLKTDFGGLPIAFHVTGGEARDSRDFETLLDIGPDLNPRAALGDKGYNSNQIATARANAEYVRQSRIDPTPRICPVDSTGDRNMMEFMLSLEDSQWRKWVDPVCLRSRRKSSGNGRGHEGEDFRRRSAGREDFAGFAGGYGKGDEAFLPQKHDRKIHGSAC